MEFTVTEAARKKVLAILESEGRKGQGLRITAVPGGFAPPQYSLNFVEGEGDPGDVIHEANGLRIFMDPESAAFVEGGSLDYLETLTGAGFKVDSPKAAAPPSPTGPQAEKVQDIIENVINPGVAQHGGWVSLVDVRDNIVYLRLGGGCQGCGMVDVTLKQGIEVLIKEKMPEITAVYDTTDHAGGKNPYYQPAK